MTIKVKSLDRVRLLGRHIQVSRIELLVYALLYFAVGMVMNTFGKLTHIAEFGHWWQVITCYDLYLVPASLLVRHRRPADQYLWGLLVIGVLEVLGYGLGTSIAHDGNILDVIFGRRNFTLVMTLFFASYIPLGNLIVARVMEAIGAERVGGTPDCLREMDEKV